MPIKQQWLLLLIEASEDIQTLIQLSLDSITALKIQTAQSSTEGIRSAQQLQPDLIILDLDTPGTPVLVALKSEPSLRQVPIILLSSRVRLTDELESIQQGVAINIQKPFNPEKLKQIVNNMLSALKSERIANLKNKDSQAQ